MNQALPTDPDTDTHALLNTATLADIPKTVCRLMNGFATVIWKPARSMSSELHRDQHEGRLYPYSSSFDSTTDIQHAGIELETDTDTTGRFYCSDAVSLFENDFPALDVNSMSRAFVTEHRLRRVCLARFDMRNGESGDFIVSVYRLEGPSGDFGDADARKLQQLAGFLPFVYQRLVASQLRQAIVKVNEILRPRCDDLQKAALPLGRLCEELASFVNFHEVSIFMRDGVSDNDVYNLIASTLNAREIKNSYRATKEDGLTGYVLATGKPVWFHDLHNFDLDTRRELIRNRYPEIDWADGGDSGRLARKVYNLSVATPPPPLPFMALPVIGEKGTILGALRASLGRNPFFFLNAQIETFEIIAAELGRWWEAILHGVEQKRRADVWEALDSTISAQHKMLKGSDDIDRLAEQTVTSIADQPGFDIAAFRRGREPNSLRLAAFGMSKREKNRSGSRDTFAARLHIPLTAEFERPSQNRGFFVGKIERTASQIAEKGSANERLLFQGMSQVLSCPVIIRSKLYGVLDVGFRDERDYTPARDRIHQFLELVARQLALFERVAESIEEVQASKDNELKTYAVVTHQLKTPLFTASRKLRGLTIRNSDVWSEPKAKILLQVAGMVRKARSVTNSIEAIGKLIDSQQVRVRCGPVRSDEAWKLCLEVAQNAMILVSERMNINFKLDTDNRQNFIFHWNGEYAEQCLDAVVTNAFKYSEVGGHVRITPVPEGRYYIIRVLNRGPFFIKADEVERCKEQNWRGEMAKERHGVGIGLWIADRFMRAQGGELKVHATLPNGVTQIDLRFLVRV